MKKIFLMVFLVSLFALSACGDDTNASDNADNSTGESSNSETSSVQVHIESGVPVGEVTFEGSKASDVEISGTTIGADNKPIGGLLVMLDLADNYGSNMVKDLKVRSDDNGNFRFKGLPDKILWVNIAPEMMSLYTYSDSMPKKYERSLFWPGLQYDNMRDFFQELDQIKPMLLTVDEGTVLKGTVKYEDGTRIPPGNVTIDVSYNNGTTQTAAFDWKQMVAENYVDPVNGSFYVEETGEFEIKNCLNGGDYEYQLHVNHRLGDQYESWNQKITLKKGGVTTVDVVLKKKVEPSE